MMLGVFGSRARGAARANSDLDVLVSFAPGRTPGLLKFVNLQNHLSDLLGIEVDLVMKQALKPRLGRHILRAGKLSSLMAEREVLDYLQAIVEAMKKIDRYTEGMSQEAFYADDKTVDAVIRNLEVVGEASKRIPTELRQRHLAVPRRDMAGMRNRLIHGYFGVSLEVVWGW